MRQFIKYFALSLVMISISILVSGCSSRTAPDPEAKTLVIWAFDDEDVWKPIMRSIENELEGYKIKYVKKELNSSYENDALNSILSGQGPDVWAIPNDWIYRHKDKLSPMPEKMALNINLEEDFVPIVGQNVYYNGSIYALTPAVDTLMVYYNQEILNDAINEFYYDHRDKADAEAVKRASQLLGQIPTTWNDFVETSKLITQKNGDTIIRSGVALGTTKTVSNSEHILYALMLQNDTKMTTDNIDTATFNLPQTTITNTDDNPAKRALEFYTSFSNPTSENYSWNDSLGNNVEAFVSGNAAMILGFESLSNYFAQVHPSFKYNKATLPQISTTNENITDYAQFTAFTVPTSSSKQQPAWTIINFLSTSYSTAYATTTKVASSENTPGASYLLASRQGSNNPGKYQTKTAVTWNKGRYPNKIDAIFKNTIIGNTASKSQSSQEALDSGAAAVTEILRKTDW